MCSSPKVTTVKAPDPAPPVAPIEAPKAMASPEDENKRRNQGGLSQLRIGSRSGQL